MLENFTLTTFADRIGETFRVDEGARPLELRLVDASAGPSRTAPRERRAPFSVVFLGPPEPVLPQRIYRLRNDNLGEFEIFIVPIGPAGDGMQYEAVFA